MQIRIRLYKVHDFELYSLYDTNLVGMIDTLNGVPATEENIDYINENIYDINFYSTNDSVLSGELIIKTGVGGGNAIEANVTDALQSLINEKISAGIVTKEDMDERISVFKENGILKDENLMIRIIKGYRKYNKSCKHPKTIYVDPEPEKFTKLHEEGIIAEGLRAAVSRHAMICEGEKSVGKNVYLDTLAWLMGMPSRLITFSRNMSPSSVYGEKTTDNSAAEALHGEEAFKYAVAKAKIESGVATKEDIDLAAKFEVLKAQSASVNIVIDQSELYDWLTDGGMIVFNEMNMAEANFFASFTNQLLDGTGYLFIPGRGEVTVNPDCVLFGTQNADYEGVEQQNAATMSRFGCLYFEQPKSVKKQLIAATKSAIREDGYDPEKLTLDDSYFDQAENFYKLCRGAVMGKSVKSDRGVNIVESGMITNACLNIRGFVRALAEVAESNGFTKLKRQVENQVINTCPTSEREPLKAILTQTISL